MKNKFSIIVAVDEKFGMGQNGGLPWNLPGDMKHFKEVTLGDSNDQRRNAVIMGRKTWESIPDRFRPLPGRLNVVISRDRAYQVPAGVLLAADFDQALMLFKDPSVLNSVADIFVIGGAEIFKIAVNHPACQTIYITHIQTTILCDCFFPSLPNTFKETFRSELMKDGHVDYFFSRYERSDTA